MGITPLSIKEGVGNPGLKVARGIYDFAVDGGAVSTITLMKDTFIPSGATIIGGWIQVHTALTSGGAATIAVQVEAANDVLAAVAVASWTTGKKDIVPDLTGGAALGASAALETTAARDISVVIAAVALTAGKFSVVLLYTDPLA